MPVSNPGAEARNYTAMFTLTATVVAAVFAVGRAIHTDTNANRAAILDVRLKQDVIGGLLERNYEVSRGNRLVMLRILRKVETLTPEEINALEPPGE